MKKNELIKMTLKEALAHLEETNRKVPLMNLMGAWMVDEMDMLLENVTQKDHVAIFLNKGDLNPSVFHKANQEREVNIKQSFIDSFQSFIVPSGMPRTNLLSNLEREVGLKESKHNDLN